jgi:hypothetical protein
VKIGCPCGCLNGVDCATKKPAPLVRDNCAGCGVLGFEALDAARIRGWHCAPNGGGCVAKRLGLVEAVAS